MSPFAVLALYPLWAVSITVLVTVLRLGRRTRAGLLSLCFFLAAWVTGLILLETPETRAIAERFAPSGILLGAAFLHAGAALVGDRRRAFIVAGYALGAAVALLGAIAPRLLYGPGARSPGPLFFPLALVSALTGAWLFGWLCRQALAAAGRDRARRAALAGACLAGSLGGGGVIGLRVLDLGDVPVAAPFLFVAVGLTGYAVLTGEEGRARELLVQGLVFALLTAALSAVGLTVLFFALPHLAPGGGRSLPWITLVIFLAALPLDPVRLLVVERAGRALFRRPIGVRDLSERAEASEARAEASEARADQAERLAEIGRMASAVAHEIRNPLGVIAAQSKLLERQGGKPETIAAMRAQIDRAKHFLDDLLRYSRPRPLERADVEVLPALSLVASNTRQVIGEGAPPITVDAPKGLTAEVDRGAFTDVATVLAHNAAIALDGVEGGAVTMRATVDGDMLLLTVEDNGPGVPQAIEATLFSPFVTGRGRDARHPGTGLGLAIAARWVERHGGTLTHERPAQGGARFLARFPLRMR
ncbi:MAG: HAMP domain-containing sensor histidine kinase [Byssovorax sp.]